MMLSSAEQPPARLPRGLLRDLPKATHVEPARAALPQHADQCAQIHRVPPLLT